MERITNFTQFYIWNDMGLVLSQYLPTFCKQLKEFSKLNLEMEEMESHISLYLSKENDLNIKFYNNGYIFLIEGNILKCIQFLQDFDSVFNKEKQFYISPTQRLEEDTKFLYPRGADGKIIARFLDKIFNNDNYSKYFKYKV